jgi:MFS family permease
MNRQHVIFMAVLVDMMGFGIVIPVLPFYALELGASPLQVTLLIASFSAMQMAATPIWGRVSTGRASAADRGLFASAVSYLIFGWRIAVATAVADGGGRAEARLVAHAYVVTTSPSGGAQGSDRAAAGLE